MPGARRVEAVKGKKGMKNSFPKKRSKLQSYFLHFNKTRFILFIGKSIYLDEGIEIAYSEMDSKRDEVKTVEYELGIKEDQLRRGSHGTGSG